MKKEIPILYSTPMVQSKMAWRKTQTRRLVKPQPSEEWMQNTRQFSSNGSMFDRKGKQLFWIEANDEEVKCPYGQPGDLLWGRESWGYTGWITKPEYAKMHGHPVYRYRATHQENIAEILPWKPSIHMPKAAARIWDEVTGIRVERIAEISKEDCIAEGIQMVYNSKKEYCGYKNYFREGNDKNTVGFGSPIASFRSLWQSINGKPKPIQARQNGKLVTIGYEVYPFDEQEAAPFNGLTTWRGKPLTVITNPWVWVIESKQLSVTGKPE